MNLNVSIRKQLRLPYLFSCNSLKKEGCGFVWKYQT